MASLQPQFIIDGAEVLTKCSLGGCKHQQLGFELFDLLLGAVQRFLLLDNLLQQVLAVTTHGGLVQFPAKYYNILAELLLLF